MAGDWVAGGPDPDHTAFALKGESDHFAIYSDETLESGLVDEALDVLETLVWTTFFGAPIYLEQPLCDRTTKYKASIHVHSDWGLSGGAWTSEHMGMWIGPGALADHWGLAHEFTHAVQSVSGGQQCDRSNTCGWVHESHANFMAHQLDEYRSNVHCSEMLVNAPHLYLGSTRDRYCNWQFMEFLKDKHCYRAVNEIWTGEPTPDPSAASCGRCNGTRPNSTTSSVSGRCTTSPGTTKDPPPTAGNDQGPTYRQEYKAITDRSEVYRSLRTTKVEPVDESNLDARRFQSPHYWAPQRFGYNVVRLFVEASAQDVQVTFKGIAQPDANVDFRWGLVATDPDIEQPRYSPMQSGSSGALNFASHRARSCFWSSPRRRPSSKASNGTKRTTPYAVIPICSKCTARGPRGFSRRQA